MTRQTLPMRCSWTTPTLLFANPRTCSRPWHIFEALLVVHFFRIFRARGGDKFLSNTRDGHQSRSIRCEATPFFGTRNVKSAGGSVVKSIEAESPIPHQHSAFSCVLSVSWYGVKTRTLLEVRSGSPQLLSELGVVKTTIMPAQRIPPCSETKMWKDLRFGFSSVSLAVARSLDGQLRAT